jgi:hypothetical protein
MGPRSGTFDPLLEGSRKGADGTLLLPYTVQDRQGADTDTGRGEMRRRWRKMMRNEMW